MRSSWLPFALGLMNYLGIGWYTSTFTEERYYAAYPVVRAEFGVYTRYAAVAGLVGCVATVLLAARCLMRRARPSWAAYVGLALGLICAVAWLLSLIFPPYVF